MEVIASCLSDEIANVRLPISGFGAPRLVNPQNYVLGFAGLQSMVEILLAMEEAAQKSDQTSGQKRGREGDSTADSYLTDE
jgi:hypothetical protein